MKGFIFAPVFLLIGANLSAPVDESASLEIRQEAGGPCYEALEIASGLLQQAETAAAGQAYDAANVRAFGAACARSCSTRMAFSTNGLP